MPFLLLKILRFAAIGLLLASLLLPWFCVPFSLHEDGRGGFAAILRESPSTPALKILLGGVLLGAGLRVSFVCCPYNLLPGPDNSTLRGGFGSCGLAANAECQPDPGRRRRPHRSRIQPSTRRMGSGSQGHSAPRIRSDSNPVKLFLRPTIGSASASCDVAGFLAGVLRICSFRMVLRDFRVLSFRNFLLAGEESRSFA